ncbi:MAG: protein kinase, partial [Deltaproteobacteria bacterium]|nr:protein kinase [Deltaproteobacteria bacterium]
MPSRQKLHATVRARACARRRVLERLTPFGKYFLLDRINVGGMAEVFRAKTVGVEGFEKIVAIKRILPAVAEDEEFIKMFVDEAKITAQLSHANLAQTFDLGKFDEAYYIAMEYVPGKDLRAVQERMRRRGERVPTAVAAYVISRVCEGLDYAHRKRDTMGRDLNIVHRDVSPQNVIVSFEGEVKLIDFGIAKAANKITRTQAGILKGKFGYMSPEQVRGLPLDRRSDIFATGVVLYELCTGERLFTGSSDFSVLEKVQQAKIVPPSEIVPDIPLRLERVILKALAREPEERYQHAAELAQDLTRFMLDSHTRTVSRDDVAAFMKSTFPDDNLREQEVAMEATRTRAPRREPPPLPDTGESDRARAAKEKAEQDKAQQEKAERERQAREKQDADARAGKKGKKKAPTLDDDEPSTTAPGRKSKPPPPLPKSLLDLGEVPPEPEPTMKGPPPEMPDAKPALGNLPDAVLPPLPKLPPLTFGEMKTPSQPPKIEPTATVQVAMDESPGDAPTRPVSMDDLAKAERELLARQQAEITRGGDKPEKAPERPQTSTEKKIAMLPTRDDAPTANDAPTEPGVFVDPKTGQPAPTSGAKMIVRADAEKPSVVVRDQNKPPSGRFDAPKLDAAKEAERARAIEQEAAQRAKAKQQLQELESAFPTGPDTDPDAKKPKSREELKPWVEKSEKPPRKKLEPPKLAGPHRAPGADKPPSLGGADKPPSVEKPPSFRSRMQVSKPTLVGEDPLPAEEITNSTVTLRQRWIRRIQIVLALLAVGIAAWAWMSVPHKKEDLQGPPTGSLTVTTEPDDAVVLLDGTMVKASIDKDYTEPKMSAQVEHVLTIRRDGFTEKLIPVTLTKGEQKIMPVKLVPLPNQLTVRSSPSGAAVFVDGVKVGLSPAYVPSV